MADVVMPRLSDSMEEGTIIKWLKATGDEVAREEPVVEIETDKATMEYEADASGPLEIIADEGATVAVGQLIARIGSDSLAADGQSLPDAGPATDAESADRPDGDPTNRSESVAVVHAPRPDNAGRVAASPVARRLADELGIDIATLTGSGPGGRIVKADVEAATPPATPGLSACQALAARRNGHGRGQAGISAPWRGGIDGQYMSWPPLTFSVAPVM